MKVRGILSVLAGVAVLAPLGLAQVNSFTLTNGNWTYEERDLAGSGSRAEGGLADFRDPSGVDHMFQNWWWYSTPDTGRDLALGRLVNLQQGVNSARITFLEDNGPNGPGALLFDFEYSLHALPGNTAVVQIGWKVHNMSGRVVPVRFFSYTDFDLGGTAGGDSGTYIPDGQFVMSDGPVSAGLLASESFRSGWEQDFFAATRNHLTDNAFSVLSNATSPLGPGDLTHAFSWETELLPNGDGAGRDQMVGSLIKYVNAVPEPGTIAVMALGLLGLRARRRK